jgi:hypothetical protein
MSTKRLSELPQHEVAFVQTVENGVGQLAQRHGGPLAVLFDIDHTLVFGSFRGQDEYLRAGFEPLVRSLKERYEDRIRFGLLTMCSEDECTPGGEKYLGVLDPLTAVTDAKFKGHASFKDIAAAGLFNFRAQKLEWEYKHIHENQFGEWTRSCLVGKLILLDKMMDEHQDTGFVVVEDLPWVRRLRDIHLRAEGVFIGPEENNKLD